MDNFDVYEVIGRGKYSTVYRGEEKRKFKKNFAIKSVDKSHKSTVHREVRILQSLDHSNVVKFYNSYETPTHLWLILEYCGGGDLLTFLEKYSKLPEDLVHDLAHDLVSGLRYLHSKGIIHCDLKPSNILFDGNDGTKLCDFGLSKDLSNSLEEGGDSKRGSPCYMAPELFEEGGVHSYASDLWALGCVLYECYAGRPPFYAGRPPFIGIELMGLVDSILTDPTPSLPGNPSPAFANLVSCLLIKDPRDRIQWSEICTHAFWGTQQISPVDLPPQLAYKESKTTPGGVHMLLLRLSKRARTNLEKEDCPNMLLLYGVDVEIENRDMELDFTEYTEEEDNEINSDDEYGNESQVIPVAIVDVLFHESDVLLQSVMPLPKQPSGSPWSGLPFIGVQPSDFVKLPETKLDAITESIITILNKGNETPIFEKKKVIRYLEMLSMGGDAAKILTKGSIILILVKMFRQSRVSALRVQLASLIGVLICHSDFINEDLAKSGLLEALKQRLVDRKEKKEVRRMSMAALGELLIYISAQSDPPQKETEASDQSDPTQKETEASGWEAPEKSIQWLKSLLGKEEDEITQLYLLKTIDRMAGVRKHLSTHFTTEDVINNLCDIFQSPDKQEPNRITAGSCLLRFVYHTSSAIRQVMDKLTFKKTAISISNQNPPKIQQISLTLLNMAIFVDNQHIPDIDRLLLPVMEDKELVPNLVWLVENGGQVLSGKTLLFLALVCKKSAQWLGIFFLDFKLLSAVDNVVEHVTDPEVYFQNCFVAYFIEVLAVIPRLLETVVSDVQQLAQEGGGGGSTSKSNLRLFRVLIFLLNSRVFEYKVGNAKTLQQLKVLIKLAASSESPFEGRDDFQTSVVCIISIMTKDPSLIVKHNVKIFLNEIIPNAITICKENKNDTVRFDCLNICHNVVVCLTRKRSSHYRMKLEEMYICYFLPLQSQLSEEEDQYSYFADLIVKKLIDYII